MHYKLEKLKESQDFLNVWRRLDLNDCTSPDDQLCLDLIKQAYNLAKTIRQRALTALREKGIETSSGAYDASHCFILSIQYINIYQRLSAKQQVERFIKEGPDSLQQLMEAVLAGKRGKYNRQWYQTLDALDGILQLARVAPDVEP